MKAKCKRCGDTVEVTRPKEFKSCKCGAINLDYGDEYYFRVVGNPENFDGEIEDAPKLLERGIDIIGEENIGGESMSMERAAELHEYLSKATKVKESFMDVNVDLCEDGTLWINDAKTDEQLAKFKVVEGE